MRNLKRGLLTLALSAGPLCGWGCDGHQIIALIARTSLTPQVSAAVDKLLSADPISTAHYKFCQDTPTDLMAVAAPWADDRKSIDKTALWHYVDIPLSVRTGDYRRWCDPVGRSVNGKDRAGCIISAIGFELAILRDAKQSGPARAGALRYVIHLVGDLTQPLHATDNHDEGGNCTSFRLPFVRNPTTLHGIWDYDLITHELQTRGITEMGLAAMLEEEFRERGKAWMVVEKDVKTDVEGWAWESHALAINVAYGLLNPPLPLARPGAGMATRASCDIDKSEVAGMNIPIPQSYMDAAKSAIHEQLARAGYRLAAVLNEALREPF